MRKLLLILVLFTLGCEKNEHTMKPLADDLVFQSYARTTTSILSSIVKETESRGTREKLLYVKSEAGLREIMGTDTYERVKAQAIQADAMLVQMKTQGRTFNRPEVEEAFRKLIVPSEAVSSGPIPINQCHWAYTTCLAAAAAGGMLCHAGCTTATAGIGVPGCVMLCLTVQAHAMASCYIEFCEKYLKDKWQEKQTTITN